MTDTPRETPEIHRVLESHCDCPSCADAKTLARELTASLVECDTLRAQLAAGAWRCFHCGEVFTDKAEAAAHFGSDEWKAPACRLAADDVTQLRELEADNESLRFEVESLENDARAWHESEADRVRRIGRIQWWQELDSREGERLVLQERAEQAEAQLAAREGEIATLKEQAANIRDAIAEHCSRYGDADYAGQSLCGCVRQLAADFAQSRAETNAADARTERTRQELDAVWSQQRKRAAAAEARADTAEAQLRAQEESLDDLRETCNEAAATGRAGTKLLTESERRIYERLALALAPPITKESQPHE